MKKMRFVIALALIIASICALNIVAYADNSVGAMTGTKSANAGGYYFWDYDVNDYILVPYGTLCQNGSQGSAVKAIQFSLSEISEYRNDIAMYPGTVDSLYGSNTASAVRRYQYCRGVSADGIVGSQTWPLLQNEYGLITGTF